MKNQLLNTLTPSSRAFLLISIVVVVIIILIFPTATQNFLTILALLPGYLTTWAAFLIVCKGGNKNANETPLK